MEENSVNHISASRHDLEMQMLKGNICMQLSMVCFAPLQGLDHS